MKDVIQTIIDVLATLGGVGVIVTGLAAWLGKVWADRIIRKEVNRHEVELERLKSTYSSELEKYKTQLSIYQTNHQRYYEFQFNLYNKLWIELYNLSTKANELWETANKNNLLNFSKQLKTTSEEIEKNMLLIEESHFEELRNLIEYFGKYQIGKTKLINVRAQADLNEITQIEIENIILNNSHLKERYSNILRYISKSFRDQIKGEEIECINQ